MIEAGTEVNARSAKFATALHITALRNLKSLSLVDRMHCSRAVMYFSWRVSSALDREGRRCESF